MVGQMRTPFLTTFLSLLLGTAMGQLQISPDENLSQETIAEMRQIQRAALADDYTYKQLQHLTDHIGPRPSGSPQAAAAVEYVAQELRGLGFEVRLEKVAVPRWVRADEKAELVSYPGQVPGTTQKIVMTSLGAPGVATGSQGITAEVLPIGSFEELASTPREKVLGKIVLFTKRFDVQMEQSGFAGAVYAQAGKYRNDG